MNKRGKWLLAGLLGLQAAFTGSTFATWSICLILYGVFAFLAMLHARWLAGDADRRHVLGSIHWIANTLLYFVTALVIVAWRFGDYAGETINPMAFAFDAAAHTAVVSALLLWAIHPFAGHPAMLVLGLFVILLCVAAGGASQSMASQVAVALATTVGFVVGSNLILGHRQAAAQVQPIAGTGKAAVPAMTAAAGLADSGRIGLLFSLLVLTGILMTTSAVARVTDYMLPNVKQIVHNQLTNSLEAIEDRSRMGNTRYVRGSRVGSIRQHMLGDPASVALRAYSNSVPGYLRGTVFDVYSDGRWAIISNERLPIHSESNAIQPRELTPSGQGLTRLQGPAHRSLRRFFLHQPDDQRIAPIEIHNDPLKGHVIFSPLATRWVEASASTITASHHNIIEGGINLSEPYVCGVAKAPRPETLEPQRGNLLLNVDGSIRKEIRQVSRSIVDPSASARVKAEAICKYFLDNFTYSLTQVPPRSSIDPIVQFLTIKHPAHCEFFATATVLLLRSAGVPARYVTGYVTTEQSDEDVFWIARNRDAHAWVEAYDDASETWFPVESTPGRRYESMLGTNMAIGSADGSNAVESDSDWNQDSVFSRVWGWLTSMRATDPLSVIFRFGMVPLFCAVGFLLWRSFRGDYHSQVDPQDIESRRMLQRIDRKVKKLSLVRQPHETLHQFALRIENSLDDEMMDPARNGEFLEQAARWYRQYAAARYRGQTPIPFGQTTA